MRPSLHARLPLAARAGSRAGLRLDPAQAWRRLPAWLCALALCACGGAAAPGGDGLGLVFDVVGPDGVARLYRSELGTQPALPVHGGVPGSRPAAHPSGQALLYAAADDPGDPWSPPVLRWLDLASGQQHRLSPDSLALELEPAVSPDGLRLVYTSQRADPGGDVMLATLQAGQLSAVRNLTPAPGPVSDPDRTPAWSPDGQWIAFTAYRDGGPALWVMDAQGGRARRVTAVGNWGDFSPSWSADGNTLAFQRVDADPVTGAVRSRIGLVPAVGGPPSFLNLAGSAYDPRYSPDGQRLAYWAKTGAGGGEIIIANLQGETLQRIDTPGADRHPAWIRF